MIGCDCPVCTSNDQRNQRLRSSLWLKIHGLSLLVDAGPDLRHQALRENIRSVDAVLYTHGHLDHVAGFDELRAFCWRRDRPLPIYANPGCMNTLQSMFAWAFSPNNTHGGYVKPDPHIVRDTFFIGPLRITPLPVFHGTVETNGYLFEAESQKKIAYIPDAKVIPNDTIALLQKCDILIIDALREQPHPTHLCVEETLSIIEQVQPQQAYLTHISHETNHQDLESRLPSNIKIAYDQLTISLDL